MSLLEKEFLVRLEHLEIAARKVRRGVRRGERLSRRRGSSVEFADHRPYAVGDDLRFLDWSILGRLDRLMVKLFHDEEDLAVHVVIDTSASMEFGNPSKLLYGLRVAASVAYVALAGQCRVRPAFLLEGGGVASPGYLRGMGASGRLLSFLEDAPKGGPNALVPGLKRMASETRPRGVLLLVSDLMDRDGIDAALSALGRCPAELHAIQVLDPVEVDPRIDGDVRLVDSEDGSVAEVTVSAEVLRAYGLRMAAYMDAVEAACRRRGIRRLVAPTSLPFEKLVLEALRGRGLLR